MCGVFCRVLQAAIISQEDSAMVSHACNSINPHMRLQTPRRCVSTPAATLLAVCSCNSRQQTAKQPTLRPAGWEHADMPAVVLPCCLCCPAALLPLQWIGTFDFDALQFKDEGEVFYFPRDDRCDVSVCCDTG
jgi:hypothetical protein